jgi:hypothetical protein
MFRLYVCDHHQVSYKYENKHEICSGFRSQNTLYMCNIIYIYIIYRIGKGNGIYNFYKTVNIGKETQ